VFITVTGVPGALGAEHFARMKDGATLANAGHFDVEIDLPALDAAATDRREVLPLVEQFVMTSAPPARRLNLLAAGRVVNLAAGEGHPAEIMDISFALHALAVEWLAREAAGMAAGVHAVPADLDREIARLKLASLGVAIDALSEQQRAYRDTFS
jgi:adenosylhomocysteinase